MLGNVSTLSQRIESILFRIETIAEYRLHTGTDPDLQKPEAKSDIGNRTVAGNAQCEARLSPKDGAGFWDWSLSCESSIRHWSRPPILFQAKCLQTRLLSVKRGAACPAMPCT
jgi:hypothetical protein